MNCKNCNTVLQDSSGFCHVCGGKVITERINTKVLIAQFMLNYIGWDNRFLVTLRAMIMRPATVISTYLDGVRSRFVPPLVFVGLGVALITIVYNTFSEEYLAIADLAGRAQLELVQDNFDDGNLNQAQYDAQMESLEMNNQIQKYLLKYYNVISFLFLPLYALISWLVFGSKYNYGEHLVINSYLQGLSFFIGIITFFISVYVYQPIMLLQIAFLIFYYLWTFSKLMNFGIGKALVKLLTFFGIIILLTIFLVVIGIISAVASKFLI